MTKHGNPRLRAALVELAWRLVRFQPNYKPVVKWRQILAKGALPPEPRAKKPSWRWPASWPSICGESAPGGSSRSSSRSKDLEMSSRGTERRTRFNEIKNNFGTWALPGV